MEAGLAEARLFSVQRHERLLFEVRRHGAVRVRDLAVELGVSELTIRRDIAALAARDLVTRVHGGATLPGRLRSGGLSRSTAFVVGAVGFAWSPIVDGVRAAAAALGVTVRFRSSDDPEIAEQVHGLLLMPGRGAERVDHLPTVLVEGQTRGTARPVDWVRTDHALGLEMAVHHLHQLGHRRVGLVPAEDSVVTPYLMEGWRTACSRWGISGSSVGREVADCRRSTALIVHSDLRAVRMAQVLAAAGERAVVSYGDEVAPTLTAVRTPRSHVGRLAVEALVSRLVDGDRRPAQGVLVAPELVVRQSSVRA